MRGGLEYDWYRKKAAATYLSRITKAQQLRSDRIESREYYE